MPDLAIHIGDLIIEIRVHWINPQLDFFWTCSVSSAKPISATKYQFLIVGLGFILPRRSEEEIRINFSDNRIIPGSIRSSAAVKGTTSTASMRIRCHNGATTICANSRRNFWESKTTKLKFLFPLRCDDEYSIELSH